VVLYEVLAGVLPFGPETLRNAGLNEIQRTIREVDPPTPAVRIVALGEQGIAIAKHRQCDVATLCRLLRAELEWIPLKAMRKDRVERYRAATEMADDIRNYLSGRALLAGPESTRYRFNKFLRRHGRFLTGGGLLILLGVGAGALLNAQLAIGLLSILVSAVFSTTVWFLFRRTQRAEKQAAMRRVDAEQARDAAERAREAAERATAAEAAARASAEESAARAREEAVKSAQVARFLREMLASVDPSQSPGGDTTLLRDILDRTAQRVESGLTGNPEVEASVRDVIGKTYMALGHYSQSEPQLLTALELRRRTLGPDHLELAESLNDLGTLLQEQGKLGEAEPLYREALAMRRRLLGDTNSVVAESLNNLAGLLYAKQEFAAAEPLFREALTMNQKLLGDEHREVATNLNNLAVVLHQQRKFSQAELPM
ncbi:MAG: tetratricopeptide repeat protein, partial [Tepidisphaeraceae bacterium]